MQFSKITEASNVLVYLGILSEGIPAVAAATYHDKESYQICRVRIPLNST